MRLQLAVTILVAALATGAHAAHTNNIMITGYWPHTNEMIRSFSDNPVQNPDGWIGENWEGSGYNIHAYFPEFPGGTEANPKGDGDFEVDYQDTSDDFWRIVDELHPVAIITFGRGAYDRSWEIESQTRNLDSWVNDYSAPTQPTPSPPDQTVPAGYIRESSLPMDSIAAAVNDASEEINVDAFVDDTGFAGGFLCEYVGYHASWYHDLHADATDDYWNVAAGHIHVGADLSRRHARLASFITLRQLTAHLDAVTPEPDGFVLLLACGALAAGRRKL